MIGTESGENLVQIVNLGDDPAVDRQQQIAAQQAGRLGGLHEARFDEPLHVLLAIFD